MLGFGGFFLQRHAEKVSLSGPSIPVSGKGCNSEPVHIPPNPHSLTKLTAQDFLVGNLELDSQSLQKLLPGGGVGGKQGGIALSTMHFFTPSLSALSFLNTQERLTPLRVPEKVIIINEELKGSD